MTKQELSQEFFTDSKSAEGLNVDFKRIFYRVLQYWYIIVLCLMIALVIAFIRNRYATRIYTVTASIIIKEAEDISGGELLYNNALVNYTPNYLNELYIIRSYPLIQSVLEELNFGVSFYSEGNFLISEAYDYIPVEAFVLNGQQTQARSLIFTIVSPTQFELKRTEGNENDKAPLPQKFVFGDTIRYDGLDLVFKVKSLQQLNLYINSAFIFKYTPIENLTGAYVAKLNANWAEEGSGVIELNVNGPNPNKDKDFLNGLIGRYQEYDLEKKNQTASRTVTFITEQLDGITDSLHQVEQQLERFKNQNVITDLSGEALRLYQKLEDLENQRAGLTVKSNYYDYLVNYIQGSTKLDQIILPSSVGINDPILTNLVSKMIDMQFELKMIDKIENPIVGEARQGINELRKDIIESVQNQKSTDKISRDYINRQIADVEKLLKFLPVAEQRLVSIQRNYTLLENLYIFLLQKRSEAAISQASNTSDIVAVNPPMQIGNPITPKPVRNYAIAAFAGVALPFIVFILLEVLNTRVQSREDIEKLTSIPFIGGVGHKKAMNNLDVLSHPKTSIAESFRALRSNLNYFLGKKEKAVFLITSSISGEGKTFTSINLASVLALSGKRTLIVGADLRKPKLFGDFNLSNEVGLSTYLAGIAEFENVLQKTSYEFLDLVSGGPVPPNPSELLLTQRMETFISEAKERYDYIIFDTPPLAIVTDALALSPFADHTLFLVRQNYTPKDLLKNIEDFYATGKLKNISIVLNDIYKSGPGYGYGYGGYGYGGAIYKTASGYYMDEDENKGGLFGRFKRS